ncbi:exodeoxyribonuclease VII large subunit [Sphaerotilus hippei]|uniref:Exodeoxyribonuclease 7 large subunit n=1 Tax=Sphaerotilus hippei TaxID=744406 RepID=A0A318GYD7_9BURK|nr:exodeoxyribonuclease VII large subunit [Sphaerotilus hippei]PXW95032.1 exodeoxyribonuclease VII large subunit [Sphaerotilus hippei]
MTATGAGPMVWGVAALVQAIGDTLQSRFAAVAVRGELSGVTRAASGHLYFTLKAPDGSASMRCAMFRRAAGLLDFRPQDGQEVELRARVALYEPRGELQLVVEGMRRAGAGALMEQFLRLKAQLEAEGLFEAARKRALPAHARRIGVITSLAAAALRDVASTLARRSPQVEVIVLPSPVQGAEAPAALVRALAQAARADLDVLIVCRGGGSLEDLWAFNDERVVRAIAACPVPVVCGVGHETDFTLADFAADLRAPTPTAAAELAAPERRACLLRLQQLAQGLQRAVQRRQDREDQRLDQLALRLARPGQVLRGHGQRLALLEQRLQAALPRRLQHEAGTLERLQQRLQAGVAGQRRQQAQALALLGLRLAALDPARVLQRGYAHLTDEQGRSLVSVGQARVRQTLTVGLADGTLQVKVSARQPLAPPPAEA